MKTKLNLVVLVLLSLLLVVNLVLPSDVLLELFWLIRHYALSLPLVVTAILAGVFIRNYLVTVSLATALICAASMGMLANDNWSVLTTVLFSIYILFIGMASVSNLFAKFVLWVCDKNELGTVKNDG